MRGQCQYIKKKLRQREGEKISDYRIRIRGKGSCQQRNVQIRRNRYSSTKDVGAGRFRAKNMANSGRV